MRSNDGKRIKKLSGMGQLIMDINNRRCDSEVYINQKIDVTELVKYIEEQKEKGNKITYFHAFIYALAKTIYKRPKLNYFVANRHLWEHKEILLSFVAKVQFDDSSEEIMLMVPFKETDTLNDVSKYVKGKVDHIRDKHNENIDKKGANNIIDIVGKFPNIIRIPIVGFLKWLDKIGWLPGFIKEDNLYYSTMIISNIGSLHSDAIYHHLSEFGTCSSLTTIGEIRDEIKIIDGKQEVRKVCEFGITLDERIADGYYFIKSVQLFQEILNNPKELEKELKD